MATWRNADFIDLHVDLSNVAFVSMNALGDYLWEDLCKQLTFSLHEIELRHKIVSVCDFNIAWFPFLLWKSVEILIIHQIYKFCKLVNIPQLCNLRSPTYMKLTTVCSILSNTSLKVLWSINKVLYSWMNCNT